MNKLIRRFLRKHSALPVLALIVALLIGLGSQAYGLKDEAQAQLVHLQGDPAVLNDVVIRGVLRDGYHRMTFQLADGAVGTETELFKQPQQIAPFRNTAGFYKVIGDKQYSARSEYGFRFNVQETQIYPWGSGESRYAEGPMRLVAYGLPYANDLLYGLAGAGDKIYFTMPVSRQIRGTNEIFELVFSDWMTRNEKQDDLESRPIAEISLAANEPGKGTYLDVLGLEAVGDTLALITITNDQLKVVGYDRHSGEVTGEAVVEPFYLSGYERESSIPSHNAQYQAFADQEQQMLNLGFYRSSSTRDQIDRTLLSFDFSEGVRLVSDVRDGYPDGLENFSEGIEMLKYKNGKLYAVVQTYEPDNEEQSRMYRGKRLLIYVYDADGLVYQGELQTSANEDLIHMYNYQSMFGFSYDELIHRVFQQIRID